MLCLHQLREPVGSALDSAPPQIAAEPRRVRLKIGPVWKLMHVVERAPMPINALALRDEKNELFVLDGPFAETKA